MLCFWWREVCVREWAAVWVCSIESGSMFGTSGGVPDNVGSFHYKTWNQEMMWALVTVTSVPFPYTPTSVCSVTPHATIAWGVLPDRVCDCNRSSFGDDSCLSLHLLDLQRERRLFPWGISGAHRGAVIRSVDRCGGETPVTSERTWASISNPALRRKRNAQQQYRIGSW